MLRNNIAIITSYNDMLSAHQPYEVYPDIIRKALHSVNAVGQVAGGVPAMCDGVTQGQDGMELSLLSREVIAMSAAVGLSHNMFDGALYLGVCDKIVPGLVMAALSFGHLPAIFVPSGPMAAACQQRKSAYSPAVCEGKADRQALLEAEAASYHAPGTCTSTVRPTPTRWWWSLWGCSFRARPLSSRMRRCAGADRSRCPPGDASDRQRQRMDADGQNGRRKSRRQRDCRAAGNRRFNQPHHAPGGDGARGGHSD
jgi:hypothetical protein